jgi:hypothetical protein
MEGKYFGRPVLAGLIATIIMSIVQAGRYVLLARPEAGIPGHGDGWGDRSDGRDHRPPRVRSSSGRSTGTQLRNSNPRLACTPAILNDSNACARAGHVRSQSSQSREVSIDGAEICDLRARRQDAVPGHKYGDLVTKAPGRDDKVPTGQFVFANSNGVRIKAFLPPCRHRVRKRVFEPHQRRPVDEHLTPAIPRHRMRWAQSTDSAAPTRATIIHRGPRPLERFDRDLVAQWQQATEEVGIMLELNTAVEAVEKQGSRLIVHAARGGEKFTYEADACPRRGARSRAR